MIRTDITETQEQQLRNRLKDHGYTFERIVHFKNYDRIIFGNSQIKISINMRGLLAEFALEAIIKACVGKDEYKPVKQSLVTDSTEAKKE